MGIQVHDQRLPGGVLEVDTNDPKLAAAAAQKFLANKAAPPQSPNMLVDAARSLPGGLTKGLAAMAGIPGDLANLMGSGMRAIGIPTRDPLQPTPEGFTGDVLGTGDSAQIGQGIAKPFGGFYAPKTGLGDFAETAGSFAPALVGGEASIGARVLDRVLAPAAAATAAGSLVSENNPGLKAGAETVAALLAHGGTRGTVALTHALSTDGAPELTAEKYLAQVAKQNKITPETIVANSFPDRGQMGAEAMGPQGVALLATLGRRGGTTGETLVNALTARSVAAPGRIMDDFATAAGIHPEAAQGNIDALVDAGREQAAPLYKAALGKPGGIISPALAELAQRPVIKGALAQAATDIRNDGGDPSRVGLFFDENGNATQASHPTAEAWDLAKKALGRSVERDAFGNRLPDSKSPGNMRISNANRALTAAMSEAIPGYGAALATSGDYLSLRSAFEAGQRHILDAKTTAAQVAAYLKDMNPAELSAYKGGIANEIFNKAQNARLAPRLLNAPAVQQKLVAALGADNAQKFLAGVQQEITLAKSGGRMMPGTGSITSDIMLNAGEQDHAANLAAALKGAQAVGQVAQGNILGGALGGIQAARHFVPDLLRSGGLNVETRNELGRLLAMPPGELAEVLRRNNVKPGTLGQALGQ